jgi:hypothetical protein
MSSEGVDLGSGDEEDYGHHCSEQHPQPQRSEHLLGGQTRTLEALFPFMLEFISFLLSLYFFFVFCFGPISVRQTPQASARGAPVALGAAGAQHGRC